jgi:folate-binding protein YgfZ
MTPRGDLGAGLARLRTACAWTWLEDRSILAVHGADRVSFLQGMLSNDVASLAAGGGTYALLLTEQGRVVGDLRVIVGADELLLDVGRDRAEAVRAALERFVVADDVELEDRADVAIALRGPRAAAVASTAFGGEVGDLVECAHASAATGGVAVRVVRLRDVGSDGFVVWTEDRSAAEVVAGALRAAGGEEVSSDAVEVVRIAAGWAREGIDFDERTLAPEVPSLARAISYRKGCYLGQEVVERVAARGHVNWLVMRLEGEGTGAPSPGDPVRRGGAEVGRITSAAVDGGRFVAIARIRREASEVGTALEVGSPDGARTARVGETPVTA